MPLGAPVRKNEPLRALRMAAALVIAAFLGAVLGLVWQSSSFGEDDDEPPPVTVATPDA